MKRRIITFLLVVWTIINLVAGTLLFVDIQVLKAPEITASVKITDINGDEAVVEAIVNVSNPNGFGLSTKNFEVVTSTSGGDEVAHVLLEGGYIPPNKNKTFMTTAHIGFKDNSPKLLTSKITGNIGVNIGFIQKTIPIVIYVITSADEIIEKLAAPAISIQIEFGNLSQKGINLTGIIEAYNPNKFDLVLGNISGVIESDTGKTVGNLEIDGGTLESEKTLEFKSTGEILLDALNYKTLSINISGKAGARIAGINESIPFSVKIQTNVPDIGSLLSPNMPLDVIILGDYKFSLKGLIDYVTIEINNPDKIDLEARNITVSFFYLNKGEKTSLTEAPLGEGIIKAQDKRDFSARVILPYSKVFTIESGRLLPDQMQITVRANITISGINQALWVEITGCQDFRFFT